MARARISDDIGREAVDKAVREAALRDDYAMAVRYTLQLLAERSEGNTLEVRVPPFGAIQCVEGPRHTRGTPPNVIEMDAETWLALATGRLSWAEAATSGTVTASGQRADLTGHIPVMRLPRV
ncbi:sterol carrier family protein [Mycetocola zhadangensis]|uniref:sterol carrier family protein n=1 Tax=Mycetocola zhadangensis TaxID=1164595 RepID=UPI003A4DB4DB